MLSIFDQILPQNYIAGTMYYCILIAKHCSLHIKKYVGISQQGIILVLHTEHCTLHNTHYTLITTYYTLHTANFSRHISHYTLPAVHCTLNLANNTLQTAHCSTGDSEVLKASVATIGSGPTWCLTLIVHCCVIV